MFDLGMSELLVIGVVALIVIGPKDLPELFRSLGRFTGKMRMMAREFSRAMEAAADESGMKDVAKDLKTATSAKSLGLDAVKDAAAKFEKWDPLKNAARPTPVAAKPAAEAAAATAATAAAAPAMGPATQALAEKQAARKAVAKEAAEKLKKPAPAAPETPAPEAAKPAKKSAAPKAAAPKAAPAAEAKPAPARKPRASRSKSTTDTSGADA